MGPSPPWSFVDLKGCGSLRSRIHCTVDELELFIFEASASFDEDLFSALMSSYLPMNSRLRCLLLDWPQIFLT